ncbi:MAG: hypothetical protein A2751_05255 [Candidatus Doudnabacteria bacterium RIFCSPHIGHO2_01_FULL_46_14]|uniref:Uncharacterized protein n=1 Tax=Candidatus Doudnabacteria bacterium RIFCSPHIGHO2_01_FULL_46_14 TaxID=1817824 RepID=A0A1F5NPA7_9BACT|nr:MAG: hypothetical protein A2751_05255 [Candidatus Doudnabacteria bacterium RIFCSPHIGHO2_01_FULL_46_14]
MPEFDRHAAQAFQNRIIERVREMERMLDNEVIGYYTEDRVDNEADARENLRGLHNYLKRAYQDLDRLMTDIENRADYR